jgi:hypothetical protein
MERNGRLNMNWAAVGAIASTVIAVVAIGFSVLEFRSQRHATVKPFFWTKLLSYDDEKAIILRNDGEGPAVIKKATFTKEKNETNRMIDLFADIGIPIWEQFETVVRGEVVPPQGEMVLLKETLEHLQGQTDSKGRIIDKEEGLRILEDWQRQRSGIHIRVELTDIYGKSVKPFVDEITARPAPNPST